MSALTLTPLAGVPRIKPGDDLSAICHQALTETDIQLEDGDILVIAQKIVSKAENRLFDLREVQPSADALALAQQTAKDPRLVELVLKESRSVLRALPGLLIVEHKLGFVCANAGIDRSNVDGDEEWVLLLPEDPSASARQIRASLEETSSNRLGVLIIDSHGRAWRMGTLGLAIGFSGLPGLVDLRGQGDLAGRELSITMVGAADELAAGASLVMGQAAEATPIVHARGFPYALREGNLNELLRPRDQDAFR